MSTIFQPHDHVQWVYEGQKVMTRFGPPGMAITCTVTKACGNTAYVTNESRGFAAWREIWDLFSYDLYLERKAARESNAT